MTKVAEVLVVAADGVVVKLVSGAVLSWVNCANSNVDAETVMTQGLAEPVHAPVQPKNWLPLVAIAVKATVSPLVKLVA